jgi:carbonic anhydrase
MISYNQIFENNRQWVNDKKSNDADFFQKLAMDQNPDYLYIGCSDSRVTAEEMMGAAPGRSSSIAILATWWSALMSM